MTQGKDASGGDPAAQSRTAAAMADIKPYVVTVAGVGLLGTPAEIAVPIVRRLRRRSGVSVGPALTNLVNGLVALAVAHYLHQRPTQWRRWKDKAIPPWAGIGGLAYLVASPVAAAGWQRGVILRRHSPLWGALVSPVGLLQIPLVLVALNRARRSRSTGASEPSSPRSAAQSVEDPPT